MPKEFVVADAAYLTAEKDGDVVLCIGSLAYTQDEKVPAALRARQRVPGADTAAEFVTQIMYRRFGDDKDHWPEIARQFISSRPQN